MIYKQNLFRCLKRGTFSVPSWTGGVPRQMSEANLARRGGGINLRKSTTPASVSSPSAPRQSPPLLSRRGVFDGESLHINMLNFNELQRRHFKRREGTQQLETLLFLVSCPSSLVPGCIQGCIKKLLSLLHY